MVVDLAIAIAVAFAFAFVLPIELGLALAPRPRRSSVELAVVPALRGGRGLRGHGRRRAAARDSGHVG
ncbi:MAG: hypothetical protein ACK5U8_17935 [Deltaproteobacteria bacterium]|jgi:hypothetical protein